MIIVISSKVIFHHFYSAISILLKPKKYQSFHERAHTFCRWLSCSVYPGNATGNVLNVSGWRTLKECCMNTTTKIITGFVAGASLGILTGILIAPNSGKKTREQIAEKTKDLKNKMTESFDDAKKAYNKEVETLLNSGKTGIDSLKNTLKV